MENDTGMSGAAGQAPLWRRRWFLTLLGGVLVLSGLLAAAKYSGLLDRLQELLRGLLEWIRGMGALGPAVFIAIYVIACVFFIPGSILTLGAGFLFDVVWGTACVSIASVSGASLAFLIGRHLARDWVGRKVSGDRRFAAIDEAVAREGWKIVLLTRLSPVFPFNLLNYAYGLTRVKFRAFLLASWIGMLPGTVMYVYLGSITQNLATLGAQDRPAGAAEWALRAVGLAATVIVTLYITRIARRALKQKIS